MYYLLVKIKLTVRIIYLNSLTAFLNDLVRSSIYQNLVEIEKDTKIERQFSYIRFNLFWSLKYSNFKLSLRIRFISIFINIKLYSTL